jgi:hypothetical protein
MTRYQNFVTAVTESPAGVVQCFLTLVIPSGVEGPCVLLEAAMPREYQFYVYMVQSSSRRALYIGMTNNLRKRIFQHKAHALKVSPTTTTRPALCIGSALKM